MTGVGRKLTRRSALRAGLGAGLASLLSAQPDRITHARDRDVSAKDAGFKLPPESSPHQRTFMQWPAQEAIYGTRRELKAVRGTIATIARAIDRFEPVVMLARDNQIAGARTALGPDIDIWPMPVDDLWCRDSGPTFVRSPDGEFAISDLNFNGWGKKQSFANDGKIAARIARKLELRRFDSGIIGESGGVEFDGEGTLLAHESSWVASGRSTLTRDEIERRLLGALGGQKMIWAPGSARCRHHRLSYRLIGTVRGAGRSTDSASGTAGPTRPVVRGRTRDTRDSQACNRRQRSQTRDYRTERPCSNSSRRSGICGELCELLCLQRRCHQRRIWRR